MTYDLYSDDAILREIGERISRSRIAKDMTQAEMARESGISRSTIERLESGQSTQLTNFIRVLTTLELIDPVMSALPADGQSPIELVRKQKSKRQRVRHGKVSAEPAAKPWRWGDQA